MKHATPIVLLSILAILLGASCALAPPTDEERHADALANWQDLRFGMFIHWGLYAIPAGEWQGNKGHGEWIRHSAKIPRSRPKTSTA